MAAPPIYNPVIPCVHPIPAGMYPGRMIRVQGSIPPGAQRFAINFQCGPNTDPRDDIALHLNFRFVEMVVVRNHLTAMNWGVEDTNGGMPLHRGESFEALILCEPMSMKMVVVRNHLTAMNWGVEDTNGGMPLHRGESFEALILCEPMSMKVALNGMHFCEFPHRIPFQRISHLTVDGDVMIQLIGFEGAQPPQQMYMSEPPAYGAYGAPPAYGAPGYGGAPQAPPAYGTPTAVPYGPQGPMMAGQQVMQAQPMIQGQQRRGMGTGAAVGMGAAALAAGGLAGYAMGGGFQGGSSNVEEVSTFSESVDFGGDDWMD